MSEVEQMNSSDDFNVYRTSCTCMDKGHVLTFSIDGFSNTSPLDYELEFYINMEPCNLWHWQDKDWFYARWWDKAKLIKKIVFDDCFDLEQRFTFRGEKQIESVITTLQQGLKKAKEHGEKKMGENKHGA